MSIPDKSREVLCYERRWVGFRPPARPGHRGVDVFDVYHFGHPRHRLFIPRGRCDARPVVTDHPDYKPSDHIGAVGTILWVVAFLASLWFF
jgi:hypothetical protein